MCALWVFYGFEIEPAEPIWPPLCLRFSVSLLLCLAVSSVLPIACYMTLVTTPAICPTYTPTRASLLFPFGSFVTALLMATVFTGDAAAPLPYPGHPKSLYPTQQISRSFSDINFYVKYSTCISFYSVHS